MKTKHFLTGALVVATLGMAGAAQAAVGYTQTSLNLRAGPGRDYPVIARIPANATVGIDGCADGFAYCDVNFQGLHGWASGRHLQILEGRRRAFVYQAGPVLPIVVFNQGDYWGRYYRDRPFYASYHPAPGFAGRGPEGYGDGRHGGPGPDDRGPDNHGRDETDFRGHDHGEGNGRHEPDWDR